MILKATDEQFTLNDEGQLLWQDKPGSPLPGAPVAKLVKGDNVLTPRLEVLAHNALKDVDPDAALGFLKDKAIMQIVKTLEPLVALQAANDCPPVVRGIFDKMHAALGIMPREDLEGDIAKLDPDTRRAVRQAGIKLGPILAFMPALNKPAAVRLRAVLWGLFNDKTLPLSVPNDGMVSQKIEDTAADKEFYQAIGYPLYGPRAIRIDMLDRVICAVYDGADKGKFQAQHQMAEWLGAPIDDLYAVLESMGHIKTYDPADEKANEKIEEKPEAAADTAADEGVDEAKADAKPREETPEKSPEKPKAQEGAEQIKPALATFRLKRGKANKAETANPHSIKPRSLKKGGPKKDVPSKKQQKQNRDDKKKRVMSAGPLKMKPEDSPFAALAALKDKTKKQLL